MFSAVYRVPCRRVSRRMLQQWRERRCNGQRLRCKHKSLHIMKIFSNSKCDLYPISGGFIRVYSCTGTLNSRSMLQALYHSQTQTHTHSHTSQACTHIVPNITAYFQAETFCLLRCKVMKFLKLTCETVKQCVYKENTQIYICVCVCRYVRVNRILRM